MKTNFEIENTFSSDMNEIIVSNWPSTNLITNWKWHGLSSKKSLGEYSIGKWIIKYKNK